MVIAEAATTRANKATWLLARLATVSPCLNASAPLGYTGCMSVISIQPGKLLIAATPSLRTRHAELLRLCARIGYSPPFEL